MLLFLRCIGGQGQNSGYLSFGSMSSPGLTGYVMIPVNWNDNTIIGTPVTAVRIDLYLATLGSSICIDETATKNSVASPFTNTDVNISGSTITIQAYGITLPTDFSPLITVHFKAPPKTTSITTGSIGVGSIHNIVGPNDIIGVPSPNPASFNLPNAYSISGQIRKPPMEDGGPPAECHGGDDLGIPNITLNIQASGNCFAASFSSPFSETVYGGYYEALEVPPYYKYTITPRKDDDTACDCGVDLEDIDTARTYLFEYDMPNLQQLIAADFNGNDVLSTLDLLNMAQCMIDAFDPPTGWSAWRFLSKADYIANNPPGSYTVVPSMPHSLTTASLTGNQYNQDFYGIKRGDIIEQGCTNCGEEEFAPPQSEERTSTQSIYLTDMELSVGQEYIIPIQMQDIKGLSVLSLEFYFDHESIEILGIEKINVTEHDYLTQKIKFEPLNGVLRSIWFTMNPEGEAFDERQEMFRLRVRALRDAKTLQGLIWQKSPGKMNRASCLCENGKKYLELTWEQNIPNRFMAQISGPNPTSSTTRVLIYLPEPSPVSIMLLNSSGVVAKQIKLDMTKGWNIMPLEHLPVYSGIYTIQITAGQYHQSLKLVKF